MAGLRFLVLICFLLTHTASVWAEVELILKVEDDGHKALPDASWLWQSLDGKTNASGLLSGKGDITLAIPNSLANVPLIIQVQHIGYKTFTDTVVVNEVKAKAIHITLIPKLFGMEEMVITAQYSPGSTEKSIHKVTVIGSEQIDNMAAVTVKDVLGNALNIRINQDNVLGSGISMQGISGQNVKILVDGVPVIGRLNGNIDLSQINLNDVERIEIVEGPLSVAYGTNALAGTINIITKKQGSQKWSLGASSYFENVGTHNLLIKGSTTIAKTSVRLSLGRNYFDGWNPSDKYFPSYSKTKADSSRFKSWKPKEQYFGRMSVFKTVKKWQLNYRLEFFKEEILNRGMPRAPYGETAFDETYQTIRTDHAFQINRSFKKHRVTGLVAYNFFDRKRNTYVKDLTTLDQQLSLQSSQHDTSRFSQWMSRATWSSTVKDRKWNYQLGYDVKHETAEGQRIEIGKASMGDYALFSSAEYHLHENIIVRPALRWSHNTIYKAPVNPSLNFKWSKNNTSFRASWAQGFRAPSLKELHFVFIDINHFIVGNKNLKAETSHNITANIQRKVLRESGLLTFSAGAYYNDIHDKINLAQTDGLQYSYVNLGRFKTHGIKLSSSRATKKLKTQLSFNYLGVASAQSVELLGAYSYTPEISASVQYRMTKAQTSISLFYKYQGEQRNFGIDETGDVIEQHLGSYHMADLSIIRTFWDKKLSVSTGLKNLFNVQNIPSSSSAGTHSGGGNSSPFGMGRMIFLKLNLSLHAKPSTK